MTQTAAHSELGYAEFGVWYDEYRASILEPALEVASASLANALGELLSDRDLARIRNTSGRVKSKRRTWRKIQQPRYEGRIVTVEDIPLVLDDLVGLRVTCINVRDIDMVQTALDGFAREPGSGLWLDPSSERDYVNEPKDSGYRGWHVNLGIGLDGVPVVCELQVRTLLQDSWGELTHEDTYSKDGALPPLVDVLSTRMADLLSVLDEIAEDLRTELDRIDQQVLEESTDETQLASEVLAGQAADAALLLDNRWRSLQRPTDLAALAWELQREFGAEVSEDWFGHGSFKRFLLHAVPDGEISTGRQGYLMPMVDAARQDASTTPEGSIGGRRIGDGSGAVTAPGAARQLKRIDPQFPLLEPTKWPVLFEHVTEAWRRAKPTDSDTATANRITRSARDMSRASGESLTRRNVEYVVKALLSFEGNRSPDGVPSPNSAGLKESFSSHTLQRMVELRILDDVSSRAATKVRRWISGQEANS